MKVYGFCAILWFIAICIDICDSKCDKYVIILKKISIGGKHWLKPINLNDINWSNYSTNIYNEINGYKGCLLELECSEKSSSCFDKKVPVKNLSTHTEIPGNATTKLPRYRKRLEVLDEPKIKIDSNKSSEANTTEDLGNATTILTRNRKRYEMLDKIKIDSNKSSEANTTEDLGNATTTLSRNRKTQEVLDEPKIKMDSNKSSEANTTEDLGNATTILTKNRKRHEVLGESNIKIDSNKSSEANTTEDPGNATKILSRNRKTQEVLDEPKIKINPNKSSETNTTESVDNRKTNIEVTNKNCSQKVISFNATKIECVGSLDNKSRVLEYETANRTYEFQSKKPNYTVNEEINTSMYDVNIIYVNENDKRKDKNNSIVFCDYAETVCVHDKSPQNHSLSDDEYNINITNHDVTTRMLQITLNRDEKSTIQPIFTGYFSPIAADSNFTKYNVSKVINPMSVDSKSVTITCKFRDDWNNCERSIDNSSLKVANNTPEYSINVYLKTNYIQNNTKAKYSKCTKDLDNTDSNSIHFECDAIGFADQNPHILLPPEVNYNTSISHRNQSNHSILKTELNDLLIWRCQIMDLNYTENTILFTEQLNYDIIYLKKCSSSRNRSNNNNSKDTLLTIENKERILNNITTNDDMKFNNTKIPHPNSTLNQDNFSTVKEKYIIKMHIVTENRNNCSQNSTFSFIEGKIINLVKDVNKENILKYDIVELKVSNCIDEKYLIKNNTQTHQQTELDIIFNNSTNKTLNSKLLYRKHEESYDKRHIILQCLYPSLSTDKIQTKSKIILECASIDMGDFNYTDLVNNTDLSRISDTNDIASQKNITKEKVNIDDIKKNQTHIGSTVIDKKNFTSNKTEHSKKCVTLECNSVELTECNNNCTSNETNSKIVENKKPENYANDKDKSKSQTFTKTNKKSEGLGQARSDLEDDDVTEKIFLIVIIAIAGGSILVILVIRKCPSQKQDNPTPTREAPAEEDTAL